MITRAILDVAPLVSTGVAPFEGTRPYLATGDADDDGTFKTVPVTYVERPSRADLEPQSGDLCVARMKATSKVIVFEGSGPLPILSTGFAVFRPDPNQVERHYLKHWLRSEQFHREKDARCSGAIQPAITNSGLSGLEISLPSLDEQRRIASILDAADVLRTKRRQALEKLDGLSEALFRQMFVEQQSDNWAQVPVEDLAAKVPGSIRTGPFGSQLLHEEFVPDGPVAVLGIDNVVTNDFRWGQRRFITAEKYEGLKRYTVYPGDVLVTIMGTTGRVAVVPDDVPLAINTKHLCCVTLNKAVCHPWFLWGCLRFHPVVLKQLGATRGAVMPGLNMGLIKGAVVPVPSMAEQLAFVDRLIRLRSVHTSASRQTAELESLFAALQHRAFRGEL